MSTSRQGTRPEHLQPRGPVSTHRLRSPPSSPPSSLASLPPPSRITGGWALRGAALAQRDRPDTRTRAQAQIRAHRHARTHTHSIESEARATWRWATRSGGGLGGGRKTWREGVRRGEERRERDRFGPRQLLREVLLDRRVSAACATGRYSFDTAAISRTRYALIRYPTTHPHLTHVHARARTQVHTRAHVHTHACT